MADWQPYFVNIRDGVVVGTQDPDMPDGTYVRVDVLPSAGGSVWNSLSGQDTPIRALREIVSQIDQGGDNGKVFARDNCIARARSILAAAKAVQK